MSDTPYLLRMEMLKIAQQRAMNKYESQQHIANIKCNIGQTSRHLDVLPEFPTIEYIIEDARKLKAFVDGQ